MGLQVGKVLQLLRFSVTHHIVAFSNIEQTYGSTVLEDLKASFRDRNESEFERTVTLWDTRLKGRPNMAKLIGGLVEQQKPEVIFVTSNRKGTAETIRACKKQGITCFGPIWDS